MIIKSKHIKCIKYQLLCQKNSIWGQKWKKAYRNLWDWDRNMKDLINNANKYYKLYWKYINKIKMMNGMKWPENNLPISVGKKIIDIIFMH